MIDRPIDPQNLLRKRNAMRKNLVSKSSLKVRIAIFGGSTTYEIKKQLELFLLDAGISSTFYESEYNRYFEDIMFPSSELLSFHPDVVFIHTTSMNIEEFPTINASKDDVNAKVEKVLAKFERLWNKAAETFSCPIIQNNFELPYYRLLGNQDSVIAQGRIHFILELNKKIADFAQKAKSFYIHDINYLSAWIGLEKWYDRNLWFSSKYAMSLICIPAFCQSLASVIIALFGKTKKALILDLDNTLWGGVIGDDGIEHIQIGHESAEAEAFTEFQQYLAMLYSRGILLTVNSKNDLENAEAGFRHPDMVLKLTEIASFQANWDLKTENTKKIARELNLGLEHFVFIDDNPSERELVKQSLPEVAVPNMGSDVSSFTSILDKSGYLEAISISHDDLKRNEYYENNARRDELRSQYADYGQYLDSLFMTARIEPFNSISCERITQLTNKTNQFNFTTKRYTLNEINQISNDTNYITLYGRLKDKFGDNGIVSVIIASKKVDTIEIELWIMSCRVLKRDMELAMLDALVHEGLRQGIRYIRGVYIPTSKNGMISTIFSDWGFIMENKGNDGKSFWILEISANYQNKNKHIEVKNG